MKLKAISVTHVLLFLGVFFVGIGAISIIASNWDAIHPAVKLATAAAMLCAALYGAYHFYRRDNRWLQELCVFAAFMLIGANIGLIAQVFHLGGSPRNAFLAWSIVALPLALVTRMRLVPFLLLPMFLFGLNIWEVLWGFMRMIERLFNYRVLALYIMASFFTVLYLLVKVGQKLGNFEMPLLAAVRLWSAVLAYITLFMLPLSIHGWRWQHVNMAELLAMFTFAAVFFAAWLCMARYFYSSMRRFYTHAVMCGLFVFWVYVILAKDLMSMGLFFMGMGILLMLMVGGFMLLRKKKSVKNAKNKR
ncbi:MAG: DUF2157 domain-containing protein [Alphaproteobacteria bacterium]|nr:DUF2157 domain-containing protein [Alphaproteobacteria bacterium]